jgi:hypothetical protein
LNCHEDNEAVSYTDEAAELVLMFRPRTENQVVPPSSLTSAVHAPVKIVPYPFKVAITVLYPTTEIEADVPPLPLAHVSETTGTVPDIIRKLPFRSVESRT